MQLVSREEFEALARRVAALEGKADKPAKPPKPAKAAEGEA